MNMNFIFSLFITVIYSRKCEAFKILFLLPYNGTSHHIYYTPLIEELARRNHEITVVNYLPMTNITNLKQISLQDQEVITKRRVVMTQYFQNVPYFLQDLFFLTKNLEDQKSMANINCEKIFSNREVLNLIRTKEKFDVFVLEQFYSDCGLAWAYSIKVPVVGITAHILLPWTYGRIGASNNPAYVPNRTGKRGILARVKAAFICLYFNYYFRYEIQRSDHSIASKILPDTPDLENVARNMSLVMVNQYFPLTGSRIYAPNVVEIGGMHIKMKGIQDQELLQFIETADDNVVYISFGSVACGLSAEKKEAILNVISKSNLRFIWKISETNKTVPKNLMIREWTSQVDILCHPKVVAFVTHSGMLSTAEAMYCGVPVVSIPIFGDQFANAQSARECGLGVTIDFLSLDESSLNNSLNEVLQDSFQTRAKYLSQVWRDRPLSPLDTATYWIEYVARHRGAPKLRPPTVNLPLYQYMMLDVWFILATVIIMTLYLKIKIILFCINCCKKR